ncbi:putative late blight resistance protein homolog R1A-3 [Coffea eugenioides]|uniref:putative late blight resistance protein homolog R1A-3 n=1 Tax=Coffea eugenioides TaxID=49369 RepID=UPI000F615709|nr:putative late blight resistance protein homolog R1A-3 [Coffea eugenioides]
MDISSSSSTSCFKFALEYIGRLHHTALAFHYGISNLKMEVRLLQSFELYLTKCRRRRNHETWLEQDEEEKDVTSSRIQGLIIRRMQDLEFVCSEYLTHSRSSDWTHIQREVTRFREAIKLFFETDIYEPCINFLLDCYWLRDPELVIDFIDSVSENLAEIDESHFKRLDEKLIFLKSFIRFAMLRGVEGQQLIDLLIHTEVVAIKALRLASKWWSDSSGYNHETKLQISRLISEKINPGDPKVQETYIHVLTASKLSISSDTSALEKSKQPVADFMDFLVQNTAELLQPCTSTPVPIMNQMLKIVEGLRFLTILLRHQEKFKELCHEMKNLIGIVACDAAIVIFSLSVNQIEEGLAKETDLDLFHLLKVIKLMRAEFTQVYPLTSVSGFGFPRICELGSMDFLLRNLKELARTDEINGSNAFPVDKIQTIQEDFEFLRSFLVKIKEQRNQNEKLQAFWSRVMEVAYKAELVIDWTLVGDGYEYFLDDVARDINVIKIEAQEIYDSIRYVGETTKGVTKTFTRMPSQVTIATYNEDLVPLDDEVKTITDSLTRGGSRQLDVVSIVGMPGLGKTTLANIVYNSPSVILHFNILAWCTVSQAYSMHNMLVQILGSIESEKLEQYRKVDEHDLAVKLKQVLLRNKYLLVLDDLWDAKAWNLLARSLPDDANGSRILITSRLQNLSLQFKPDSKVHPLRRLTDEESWKLLQKKLFGKEDCPPRLSQVASQIAKSCRGLPLTVVLVAGILANTAEDCWEEVTKSLTSSIVLDDEYCMKTLELSYSHLPDDLKPCILCFRAFQEDKNVPVRRLFWLWISEGFVRKTEGMRLEDVADDYLKDLVDRSLVMVSEQRTMGSVKACRVHDLVHEFCVKKAKEENFLHVLHSWNDHTGPNNLLRVCNRSVRNLRIWELVLEFPNVRSLLLFKEDDLGFWLPKLLRVLDLGELDFGAYFPMEVFLLAHLRYLALRTTKVNFIPAAIGNLSRLQTFLLRRNDIDCLLPKTICNIKTLRHLWTTNPYIGFIFPVENLEVSPVLDHLDTLSLTIDPSSQSLQKILTKLPNIRRLRCKMRKSREEPTRICDRILVFDCLNKLESLTLPFFDEYGFKFPLNLKKLTLIHNEQPWSEISKIGKLPNLEVLKLLEHSSGEEWEMQEGEFPNLRVLKLRALWEFRSWIASSDNFPRLEKLIVHDCHQLEAVPSCLGESPTLEMIEVKLCRESVSSSVKQIQQEQIDMGNEVLKISIEHCVDARSSSEEEEVSNPSETESIPSQESN